MSRFQLVFAALLVALLIGAVRLFDGGLRLETRLADLAPQLHRSERARELLADADAFGAASVRFLVVAKTPSASSQRLADDATLEAATATLEDQLDGIDGLVRLDPQQREQDLLARLIPHRFALLPPSAVAAVDDGDVQRVADAALDALYAPGISVSPLPFEQDPLGLFGDWLASRLPGDASEPAERTVESGPDGRIVDVQRRADTTVSEVRLAQSLEAARLAVLNAHPEVTVHRTGVMLFAREASESSRADIDRISIGSLLGLALLLLPVFRSFWPLLLPALSIVVGAASGAVLVWSLYGSMHVLTLVFGASLIGIVIDYSVHGFAHASSAGGTNGREAFVDRPRHALPPALGRALLLSLATSAIGYAALGLSSVDALARVAVFSVGGLLGAWLTVIAWLPRMSAGGIRFEPALLAWPVRGLTRLGQQPLRWWARRAGRTALLVGGVLLLGAAWLRGGSDDDPRRLIDLSAELVADAQTIGRYQSAAGDDPDVARRLLITAGTTDTLWTTLAQLAAAVPDDIRLTSVVDWLPSPAERAANRQRSVALLADGGPAAELLELGGEPDPAARLEALRTVLATSDAQPLSAQALLADAVLGLPPLLRRTASGVAALAFINRDADAQALLAAIDSVELPPDTTVELIDAVADTDAELARQRLWATLLLVLAVVAVALLLLCVYRRRSVLALVAVPAGAIVLTLIVLSLGGVQLTLFHAVGLFLVLGLGMDYTIFLAELGERDAGTTLPAIVLSAATSLLSFGLLAASSIPVARFFGQTVLIGNAFNLVLTFVLLDYLTRRMSPVPNLPTADDRPAA